MKQILFLLTTVAAISVPAIAKADFLQVEDSGGNIQVTNIFNKPIYVNDIVLLEQTVNDFGAPTGIGNEFTLSIQSVLAPRESKIVYARRTVAATTQFVLWRNRQAIYREGVRVCFKNAYNNYVYTSRYGQGECSKLK